MSESKKTVLSMDQGNKPDFPMKDELSDDAVQRGCRKVRNILRILHEISAIYREDLNDIPEHFLIPEDLRYWNSISTKLRDYHVSLVDDHVESQNLFDILDDAFLNQVSYLKMRCFEGENEKSARQLAYLLYTTLANVTLQEYREASLESLMYISEWIESEES